VGGVDEDPPCVPEPGTWAVYNDTTMESTSRSRTGLSDRFAPETKVEGLVDHHGVDRSDAKVGHLGKGGSNSI
jgi:hypothetical protein